MAPLRSMVVCVALSIACDSHGTISFVLRATSAILLLGWPLAPSLLSLLSRLTPSKDQLASTGGRSVRYLMWLCRGALAALGARRLGRILRIVPEGLARLPSPTWTQKMC